MIRLSCFLFSVFILVSIGLAEAGDESTIEQLCKNGGIVQLEARTYTIQNSFTIPSNTDLRGNNNTILRFADECGIPQNIPMIAINNANNVKVSGIRFEGNQDKQTYALNIHSSTHPEQDGKKAYGKQVGTFIYAQNTNNITVTNCAFNDNLGDGLRLSGCTNIEFAYNTGQMGGHDTFFALRSEGIQVHHNNIKPLVNSAIRMLDCSAVRVHHNFIEWVGPRDAGPSIQIQHDKGVMRDIEVCKNVIISSWGPGLWLVGKTNGNDELWLHHNLFVNCGKNHGIYWVGGIIASGYDNARIENNVFDGSYLGAVNFYAVNQGWATSAKTAVTANVLTNSIPGENSGTGGYGVNNQINEQSVSSSQNCYWNNKAGNVKGCSVSSTDLFIDPKTNPTPSGWRWVNNQWECDEVNPAELGNISGNLYDGLNPLTDEEIEQFEFSNIFDIFSLKFDTNINISSANKPDGYKQTDTVDVVVLDNNINPQTRYFVKLDNWTTKVCYEYQGNKSWHFLKTGIKNGKAGEINDFDMWKKADGVGSINNVFIIPGVLNNTNDVQITVFDAFGEEKTIQNYNVSIYKEDLTDAINPLAFLALSIILILLGGILINLQAVRRKWR
jgi:Disaggregatase related